jgi:uncharacterized lipoprotein YajG
MSKLTTGVAVLLLSGCITTSNAVQFCGMKPLGKQDGIMFVLLSCEDHKEE